MHDVGVTCSHRGDSLEYFGGGVGVHATVVEGGGLVGIGLGVGEPRDHLHLLE